MSLLRSIAFLSVVLFLNRVEAQGPTPPRSDAYGDPLPKGATARIGTVRFQHGNRVSHIVYTPDGKEVITLGYDQAVSVWNVDTGKERLRFDAGKNPQRFALSPDGKLLAVPAGKNPIRLWQLADGKELPSIGGEKVDADRIAFSPDGKFLAAVGSTWGNQVRLWELSSGKEIPRFPAVRDPVFSLCFSPDGKRLATARDYDSIRIWDVASGKQIHLLQGTGSWVFHMTFTPDGKHLVTSNSRGPIHVWDVSTGQVQRVFGGLDGAFGSIVLTPGGKQLVSEGYDGMVRIWDSVSGKELDSFRHAPIVHSTQPLALSTDGKTLAIGTAFRFFDLATGKEKESRPLGGGLIRWSPDGKTLLTGEAPLLICDPVSGKVRQHLPLPGFEVAIDFAFSADGQSVLCLGNAGNLLKWNACSGLEESRINIPSGNAVGFNSDGQMLANSRSVRIVTLLDSATGNKIREFEIPLDAKQRRRGRGVYAVAFSPDSNQLLSFSFAEPATEQEKASHGTLRLWDVKNGRVNQILKVERGPDSSGSSVHLTGLAFDPDNQFIASVDSNQNLRVWEVATGGTCYFHGFSPDSLHAIKYSPDGRFLAIGIGKQVAIVSAFDSTRSLARFDGHRDTIRHLAFSPDGKSLASTSFDGTTLVWEIPRHTNVKPFQFEPKAIDALWANLMKPNARNAFESIGQLVSTPIQAVELFRKHLKPATSPTTEKRLAELVAGLDHKEFKVRDSASRELQKLGRWAEPVLRAALAKSTSPEVQQRATALLAIRDSEPYLAEELASFRAIRVLSGIDSADSKTLLTTLSRGDDTSPITRLAKSVLTRMSK